ILQHFIDTVGWRQTYMGVGVFCLAAMLPLALVYRRRPPSVALGAASAPVHAQRYFIREAGRFDPSRPLGFSPGALQILFCIAGVACCVAMAMPQVHIV